MSAPCADCGMDTAPCTGRRGCRHKGRWEYYMVRAEVWSAGGLASGFLCIGCLEARLGRVLTPSDFPALPVNEWSPWDTPRLESRKNVHGMCTDATQRA